MRKFRLQRVSRQSQQLPHGRDVQGGLSGPKQVRTFEREESESCGDVQKAYVYPKVCWKEFRHNFKYGIHTYDNQQT